MKKKFFANLWLTFHSWSPCSFSAYSIKILISIDFVEWSSSCQKTNAPPVIFWTVIYILCKQKSIIPLRFLTDRSIILVVYLILISPNLNVEKNNSFKIALKRLNLLCDFIISAIKASYRCILLPISI